jgi:cobalt/nickel transport system permease protein
MHIPDGYLSPETCAVMTGAMVPVWTAAARRVRRVVKRQYVPLLALGAAFTFLVMMFNVPIPDGTTAHGVGATLVAIVLGPWAAVISVTAALAVQALFFGDGGVLAFGANAFNMAFVMPMVGYGLYRAVTRRLPATSPKRALAAGMSAYVAINAAALCAAIEFGIQPDLFRAADGSPLYAPFHLSQTVPAMLLAHLTVAGFVEAALTAGIIAYLCRANPAVMRINRDPAPLGDVELTHGVDLLEPAARTRVKSPWRWAAVGLVGVAVLTPLGLLAPGGAFGEAAPGDLDLGTYGLRAVPAGLARYNSFWSHTLLGDYGFGPGQNQTLGYLTSAVVGIVVIATAVLAGYGIVRLVSRSTRRTTRRTGGPVRTETMSGMS